MDVFHQQALLDETIHEAAEDGYYVIACSEFQAVLGKVASAEQRFLSGGLWGLVFGERTHRVLVTVSADGEVTREKFRTQP